jgi:hypothetical protein
MEPIRIKRNVLLEGAEKTMALTEAMLLKQVSELAAGLTGESSASSLARVSDDQLIAVESAYGAGGVYRLAYMASAHSPGDFEHFFSLMAEDLMMAPVRAEMEQHELSCDNERLPQSQELDKLALNVLQPSLSRKLYNPGRHPGYLVYGLGGPKILVSHPFRGIAASREVYDVYRNSIDVVTSLMIRGFNGTFLFLDNLLGLDAEVQGIPAWLAWFAIVSAHSDLVVYIEDPERGLTDSQRREVAFTPDRVQKKAVEIPADELMWATAHEDVVVDLYLSGGAVQTKEDFYAQETEHARPMIEQYASGGFPTDMLYRLDEEGDWTDYPLDYPLYGEG